MNPHVDARSRSEVCLARFCKLWSRRYSLASSPTVVAQTTSHCLVTATACGHSNQLVTQQPGHALAFLQQELCCQSSENDHKQIIFFVQIEMQTQRFFMKNSEKSIFDKKLSIAILNRLNQIIMYVMI